MTLFDEASASGYKLIDARGSAWSDWYPAQWMGILNQSCDSSYCCLLGVPGICCYALDFPGLWFVDDECLAWLQTNTPGDFPPVIDPSEFDPDAPLSEVGTGESGTDVSGDDSTGLGLLQLGSFSVPWWLIVGAVLLLRKRKR